MSDACDDATLAQLGLCGDLRLNHKQQMNKALGKLQQKYRSLREEMQRIADGESPAQEIARKALEKNEE